MKIKSLSEVDINKILDLIRKNCPYREILKEFPSINSISMITRIKKIYLHGEKPKSKKLNDKTKRKIQIAATERKALEKSELIVNRYVNIVEAFTYSIKNLDQIQELHKSKTNEIFILLNELIKRLDNFFSKGTISPDDQIYLRTKLLDAANNISDIHKNSHLRIRAIDSLRAQVDSFLKFKIEIEGIEQVNHLIKAFLKGTEVFNDEQYFRYKETVIDYDKFARIFFDRWDAGVYESAESGEAVIVDEKDEANSQHPNKQE